jgi:hypothetical protein
LVELLAGVFDGDPLLAIEGGTVNVGSVFAVDGGEQG